MADGKKTCEYHTIHKHFSTIEEALAAQVDPTSFAQKLHSAGLVTSHILDQASLQTRTLPERIRPVIKAVQSQVELQASTYYDFAKVLEDVYPALADRLKEYFSKFSVPTMHDSENYYTV